MKRPTPAERDQLAAKVARVRRQRDQAPAPPAGDVEQLGEVHEITAVDARHALVERILELDVAATIRAGERGDDMRAELGRLGFRFGGRAIGVPR